MNSVTLHAGVRSTTDVGEAFARENECLRNSDRRNLVLPRVCKLSLTVFAASNETRGRRDAKTHRFPSAQLGADRSGGAAVAAEGHRGIAAVSKHPVCKSVCGLGKFPLKRIANPDCRCDRAATPVVRFLRDDQSFGRRLMPGRSTAPRSDPNPSSAGGSRTPMRSRCEQSISLKAGICQRESVSLGRDLFRHVGTSPSNQVRLTR